jgi:hypothetical protein
MLELKTVTNFESMREQARWPGNEQINGYSLSLIRVDVRRR